MQYIIMTEFIGLYYRTEGNAMNECRSCTRGRNGVPVTLQDIPFTSVSLC